MRKSSQGCWGGGNCKLNRALKEGLTGKVTFVQRLDSDEGMNCVDTWRTAVPS